MPDLHVRRRADVGQANNPLDVKNAEHISMLLLLASYTPQENSIVQDS